MSTNKPNIISVVFNIAATILRKKMQTSFLAGKPLRNCPDIFANISEKILSSKSCPLEPLRRLFKFAHRMDSHINLWDCTSRYDITWKKMQCM